MIKLENIGKVYGTDVILENVNLVINEGDKVAIVGKNGTGKSTLMNIMIHPDSSTTGTVSFRGKSIGYLSQEVFNSLESTLNDELEKIDLDLYNLNIKMAKYDQLYNDTKDEKYLKEFIKLTDRYSELGGYEKTHQIQKLITIFGFQKSDLQKKVKEFSGGQRTVLSLIKLLLIEPDYLFLDEPTNHLDIEKIEWLENYLKNYKKVVVVISHDRYFIDRVAKRIIEIEHKTTHVYNTNYQNFLREKQERYALQLANYEKQQKFIKKCNDFIERFRGKPSKIGQVNDRKHKLENLDIIVKPIFDISKIDFEFLAENPKKATYIDVLNADIGYSEVLLKDVNIKVFAQEKLAIIGKNATGKSTLLKSFLKELAPLKGQIILHPTLKIGYFSQDIFNKFEDYTVYEYAKKLMPEATQTAIRKQLAAFLFKKDDIYKKINVLSGGELVRLNLLDFALEKYDLLVLDEPTNHLDINSKQILENALKSYDGTIICVSHDRYFLNQVFKEYIYLNNGQIFQFTGKYDDYLKYSDIQIASPKEVKVKTKEQPAKKKKINQMKVNKIETEIENLELNKDDLNEKIANLSQKKEWDELRILSSKLAEVEEALNIKYQLYEEETNVN